MSRISKCSLPCRFLHQNPVCTSPPHVLHTPPVSFFFIWSSKKHFMKSKGYKAPLYAVITPLPPRLSAPYSRKTSACVSPSKRCTLKIHFDIITSPTSTFSK
jgi:hypothetical protein